MKTECEMEYKAMCCLFMVSLIIILCIVLVMTFSLCKSCFCDKCFENCDWFTVVKESCFEDGECRCCSKLQNSKNVCISYNISKIPPRKFYRNSILECIEILSDSKSLKISENAFAEAKNLKDVDISTEELTLEKNVFANCTNLEMIKISANKLCFKDGSFEGVPVSCGIKFDSKLESIKELVLNEYEHWGLTPEHKIKFGNKDDVAIKELLENKLYDSIDNLIKASVKKSLHIRDCDEIYEKKCSGHEFYENREKNYKGAFFDVIPNEFVFWLGHDPLYGLCVSILVGGKNKNNFRNQLITTIESEKYRYEGKFNSFRNEGYWYTITLSDLYLNNDNSKIKQIENLIIDDYLSDEIVSKIIEIIDAVKVDLSEKDK